jgi:hypothetical protein
MILLGHKNNSSQFLTQIGSSSGIGGGVRAQSGFRDSNRARASRYSFPISEPTDLQRMILMKWRTN